MKSHTNHDDIDLQSTSKVGWDKSAEQFLRGVTQS